MKFICEKDHLNTALALVQRALPSRSTLNVLEGVYIQAYENSILLKCSDLTLTIETTISAFVEEEGSIILGKLFFDMIKHMPAGKVELHSNFENSVNIKGERTKFTLQALQVDEFPSIPQINKMGEISLSKQVFKDMIRQTIFSTAVDENKPILTGALFEITKEGVNMVALDGYRLALKSYPMPCADEFDMVLPAKSLNEISRVLDDEGDVTVVYGSGYAFIDMDSAKIYTQLLSGEYTKYRQIIKDEFQTRIKVNRDDLLQSIERASIMARESRNNLIKLSITGECIIVTSNSEIGNTYDEVPVEFTGNELEIAFNSRYLTDVLKVVDDEEIYMNFNSSVSPCTIQPVDSNDFLFLILPVRIYG